MKSLVIALLTGLLASLLLFWLMQAMIMPDEQAVRKTEPLHQVEFVRLKREPPPPKPKPKPSEKPKPPEPVKASPKPPAPKKAPKPKQVPKPAPVKAPKPAPVKAPSPKPVPDLPPLDLAEPAKMDAPAKVNVPTAASQPRTETPAPAETDTGVSSNVVALVQVPPKYPRRAANRRIQGWVKIEFTITRTGTVKDAVVVEAKPNGIFDKVALEAINKWKFKEKRVNGAPVEQRAVQVLQFKLTK